MEDILLFGVCSICGEELWNFPGVKIPVQTTIAKQPMNYDVVFKTVCLECLPTSNQILNEKRRLGDYIPDYIWDRKARLVPSGTVLRVQNKNQSDKSLEGDVETTKRRKEINSAQMPGVQTAGKVATPRSGDSKA